MAKFKLYPHGHYLRTRFGNRKSRAAAHRPLDEFGKPTPAAPWQRVQFVTLRCPELGKAHVVDIFQQRLLKMRASVAAWAADVEVFQKLYPGRTRMVMVLLTYRKISDYRPGHVNLYLKDIKRRLGKGLITFAWVAELQERGAVHYHVVLLVWRGTKIPMPDSSGMWLHGISGIRTARTPYYLLKYAGKEYQKDLSRYPKSCRLYAVSPRLTVGHLVALDTGLPVPLPAAAEGPNPEAYWAPKWEYVGSAVTRGFAEGLIPDGDVQV